MSTPLCGSFKYSMNTEEFDKANSQKQMWLSQTTATTSTVTSSHTTLGTVTSRRTTTKQNCRINVQQ